MLDLNPLNQILQKHNKDSENLISILQDTQELYGYLPKDAIYEIAKNLNISPARIMGVATFYAQFRLQPVGKHVISLCKGTACHVNGADLIETAITNELKIKNHETTEDGLFTLQEVACLGCCSLSPVMMIGEEVYSSLNPDKTASVLKKIKKDEETK